MHLRVLACCLISLVCIQANAFESGMLPGEGPKQIIATVEQMNLHRAPSSFSRIARKLKLDKGAEIKFDEVRFRTIKPGLFVAERSGSFDGSSYGVISYLSREDYYNFAAKWQSFDYARGDTIEYLQYRAEGSGFVRFRGEVISAELLSRKCLPLAQIRDPITELWIRVIDNNANPMGWYRVDDDTVKKLLPRSYWPGPRRLKGPLDSSPSSKSQ